MLELLDVECAVKLDMKTTI